MPVEEPNKVNAFMDESVVEAVSIICAGTAFWALLCVQNVFRCLFQPINVASCISVVMYIIFFSRIVTHPSVPSFIVSRWACANVRIIDESSPSGPCSYHARKANSHTAKQLKHSNAFCQHHGYYCETRRQHRHGIVVLYPW